METQIEGVSDEALTDIIFELGQQASHISWGNEERAEEYRTVANHLRDSRIIECDECGEEKEYVDEPMMSGVRGYFCTTEGCPIDG